MNLQEPAPAGPAAAQGWQHIVRLDQVDMTFGKVQALSGVDAKA